MRVISRLNITGILIYVFTFSFLDIVFAYLFLYYKDDSREADRKPGKNQTRDLVGNGLTISLPG